MKLLSQHGLITAYLNSIDLQLEKEFIQLLLFELQRREIDIDHFSVHNCETNKLADETLE